MHQRGQGRGIYICESEYDLMLRTANREAQYAFNGISEEQWEPPLLSRTEWPWCGRSTWLWSRKSSGA